eukprot:9841312-Alexandrium_andersonii.AAC.1
MCIRDRQAHGACAAVSLAHAIARPHVRASATRKNELDVLAAARAFAVLSSGPRDKCFPRRLT